MCCNSGCCVLCPCRISHFKVLLPSLCIQTQPATLFSLPELGLKLLEHNFHIPYGDAAFNLTIFYRSDKHICFHAAPHSLPRLCPSFPVHSQKLPLSLIQTALWYLLTTRQVRSCVLAPKTHPACGLLKIAPLITTATLFQIPPTHVFISPVWAGSGASLEWHPTRNTPPASGYEKMGNTKQYLLLSCETACHRNLWVQRDLELAR